LRWAFRPASCSDIAHTPQAIETNASAMSSIQSNRRDSGTLAMRPTEKASRKPPVSLEELVRRGLIPRPVRMPSVERRVAAVTPRATPVAGWAAVPPSPPIISTRIGTTPIQMARPARSPVTVGAAPVGDLNDHRRHVGERLNRHRPKLRGCRRRNRGAEEKRKRFQQSGLLLLRQTEEHSSSISQRFFTVI
jgi:hypothetical protein